MSPIRALWLAIAWLALLASAHAQPGLSSFFEDDLFQLANQARAEHGLAPLLWDPALARAARLHAARIAHQPGELEHQYPGEPGMLDRAASAGAHFTTISENLARGRADPRVLQQLWMTTPVHRANLLNPHLDSVGIGVVEIAGTLFAVEDFSQSLPVLNRAEIASRITAALTAHGLTITPPSHPSELCRDGKDLIASALLVVQWDGPDPTTLPDVLLTQLAGRTYRSGTLNVCARTRPTGALTYRVTVLLH